MTLTLEFPKSFQSPLGRVDPRWKLAALIPAALAVALLRNLNPALASLAGALVLIGLGRIPVGWYLRRMGMVALFLILFLAWVPFLFDEPGATWMIGTVSISPRGLTWAATLLVRTLALVTLMLVLLATAPIQDTLKAAHALRIPGLVVQLCLLTFRYVFLLGEEFRRLRTALRVRGYRNRATWHSYRTIGQVAGTLLVRGHERAERVGQAMRCRGFDGVFRSLHGFTTRWPDVLAFFLILISSAALLIWDFWMK